MLGIVEQVALPLFVVLIMLGMGATLRLAAFRAALAAPAGVLIGLGCQFGLMPAIAFGLAALFGLAPAVALSLILVGATPGGTTSNLFTYYARGDVALSIAMTVASTAAAVVLMPLAVAMYTSGAPVEIPYGNIVVTLVLVLVPVAVGMAVLARSEVWGRRLERIGSGAGIVLILVLIVRFFVEQNALFLSTPGAILAAAVLLGVVGYAAGYLVASALGLGSRRARTVALETGIQNTPLTIALIVLSFPEEVQTEMLTLPVFYAVFVVMTAAAAALLFRSLPDRAVA